MDSHQMITRRYSCLLSLSQEEKWKWRQLSYIINRKCRSCRWNNRTSQKRSIATLLFPPLSADAPWIIHKILKVPIHSYTVASLAWFIRIFYDWKISLNANLFGQEYRYFVLEQGRNVWEIKLYLFAWREGWFWCLIRSALI